MIHFLQAVAGVVLIAALLAVPTWADWLIRRKRGTPSPPAPARAVAAELPVPAPAVAVQASATEAVPYDRGPLAFGTREGA